MFLMSLVNYQALLDQVHWFYIAGVGSLMAVLFLGPKLWGPGAGSRCRAAITFSRRNG